VANKLSKVTNNHVFASMMLQLHAQEKQRHQLRNQLERANQQILVQDKLICELESDLEHMIEQFSKSMPDSDNQQNKWISNPLPGICNASNKQAV